MVAEHNSQNPSQQFSASVEAAFTRAFEALGSRDEGAMDLLTAAARAAGEEARQLSLTPEELMLAFKEIEQRLRIAGPEFRGRTSLIRAMLEVYYG